MESKSKTPRCVGIIMDGNRRWARQNCLPTLEGHRKGYAKLKEFLSWAKAREVKAVIAYAFSAENWKRTEVEVGYLLNLFRFALRSEINELRKDGTRLIFIGDKFSLPADIQKMMADAEETTKNNQGTILGIAVSYGGRQEITAALDELLRMKIPASEESISSRLWTKDLPDPDTIIRTGGQKRLSGFLPWQSMYSELFFTDTLWPDFSKSEFEVMLSEYAERQRNFGK